MVEVQHHMVVHMAAETVAQLDYGLGAAEEEEDRANCGSAVEVVVVEVDIVL